MAQMTRPTAVLLMIAYIGHAAASPRTIDLPDPTAEFRKPPDRAYAAGFEAASGNCMTCHSVDYVAMQPPKKGLKFWEAEVTKMVKVYKAPIDDQEAKHIAEYLSATY